MNEQERIKIIENYNARHGHPVKMTEANHYFGIAVKCLKEGMKDACGQMIMQEKKLEDLQYFIILLNFPALKELHKNDNDNEEKLVSHVSHILGHEILHKAICEVYKVHKKKVQYWASSTLDNSLVRKWLDGYLGGHDYLLNVYSKKQLDKMNFDGRVGASLIADHVK